MMNTLWTLPAIAPRILFEPQLAGFWQALIFPAPLP